MTTIASKAPSTPLFVVDSAMYHYNDTYMYNSKMIRLEEEIQKIKQEIGAMGDMRPGSLTRQMRKAKGKYGSYWHLSYTHRGKGRTQYIRQEFVTQIKAETAAFRRFKRLIDRLIALSIERSQLRMKAEKSAASIDPRTR
jgi:hypothetical protein